MVSLSVCLSASRLFIVLKQQKMSTRFLLRTTAPCLSQIVLKFALHRSIPYSKFCIKVTPRWFERRRHSMTNCSRMVRDLEIAQWSQWGAYRKPPSLFRMVPSLTSPPRKWRSQMHHQDQLRDAYCHLANTIEDIDKLCGVPNAIMSHRAMSPFAKSPWPI